MKESKYIQSIQTESIQTE